MNQERIQLKVFIRSYALREKVGHDIKDDKQTYSNHVTHFAINQNIVSNLFLIGK